MTSNEYSLILHSRQLNIITQLECNSLIRCPLCGQCGDSMNISTIHIQHLAPSIIRGRQLIRMGVDMSSVCSFCHHKYSRTSRRISQEKQYTNSWWRDVVGKPNDFPINTRMFTENHHKCIFLFVNQCLSCSMWPKCLQQQHFRNNCRMKQNTW